MASAEASSVTIKVEFSGGLELLFSNQRSHTLTLPAAVPTDNATTVPVSSTTEATKPADITYLIHYLRDHLLKERAELFEENGTVRPGILVLINDTDWELEGEGDYVVKEGDEVVFISTLHGG
ncbi:ubiquitin-related modifier 1 [Ephemerocybe angulata]|uniref:Ubiquitin-related modifier 1 n=1 Tax=Ephemerocybe angulata TaxID=980116 RepID=A0A8H6M491_9AGAR|nr:ubiquitin-related modifier 1 [Tulosesus angulatus]